jgi:hypothetical protein
VTADNWSFVFAAYGLAVIVLTTYWRFLVRRERELSEGDALRRHGSGMPEPQPERRSP